VEAKQAGSNWAIVDDGKEYLIRNEDQALKVYARSHQSSSEALLQLAQKGYKAYTKLFDDEQAREVIQGAMSLGQRGIIEITSEDFFLPWELLYTSNPGDRPLNEDMYDDFWGMRYIIYRIIPGVHPFRDVPPRIQSRPNLGLLTDKDLRYVEEREIPFFRALQSEGKIRLVPLEALDPADKSAGFQKLKKAWNEPLHLAHFACHAEYKDRPDPDESFVRLSDEFIITIAEMRMNRECGESHPLVILNACETGNLNPRYTASFVRAFLKYYDAQGVVATECAVPDAFAAEFIRHLYTDLLDGRPLGESLMAARRYYLEKHKNPAGLLYSLYASPDTRVSPI
jgi:hypothetical protein